MLAQNFGLDSPDRPAVVTCVDCGGTGHRPNPAPTIGVAPCLGCGHSVRHHVNGRGLCLVARCRLCLVYRPSR